MRLRDKLLSIGVKGEDNALPARAMVEIYEETFKRKFKKASMGSRKGQKLRGRVRGMATSLQKINDFKVTEIKAAENSGSTINAYYL